MKIQLPDGRKEDLNEHITIEEKKQVVEELTERWMPTILQNWDSNSVRFFLDGLSNYLVWHKEENESKHDKEVMSKNKTNRMIRGRKDIPFSSLSKNDFEKLFGETGGNE